MSEHSRLPWRIDRDNEDGIEIVADDGDLVLITNYRDISTETPPTLRDKIIARCRANFYLVLKAVNQTKGRDRWSAIGVELLVDERAQELAHLLNTNGK